MMTCLPIVLFIFASFFDSTDSALQCYACNPCGTTWNPAVATLIQTSNPNDYCRKTVSGTLVVKDSASTCNPVNFVNNGVYCCQTDLCNQATNQYSLKIYNLGFLMILIWTINRNIY